MRTLIGDSVSVVVKGSFNPPLFSPAWLLSRGVIGTVEYDDSKVEIISPDVASFTCGWLMLAVTRDIQLVTNEIDEFERLRDAMVAILRSMPHCPVGALGVNRDAHMEVGGEENWHRIGDLLAPKAVWEGALRLPGMKSLTLWGVRPDNEAGRQHVTIEPSNRLQYGIYASHNDHYDLQPV